MEKKKNKKTQVKATSSEKIPFWISVLSWVKGDQWKTIFTIVKVALIVLLCGPCILQCVMNFVTQRLVVFSQIGGQRARVQYIFMNDAQKLRASSGETEGGNRTGSVFKAGLHLGPDCGL